MKNKSLFLCMFFLILSNIINAQMVITGTVLDKSEEAVMFANIVVLKNSKIITGTITDIKGKFKIETQEKGDFDIQISFVGFNNFSQTIHSSIDFGTITLLRNSQLHEILIKGHRKIIEQKVDRLVFNVNNSPFLGASDGVEILNRTPRIISRNDEISILGKDNVRIMINDRMTTLSGAELTMYLRSLSTKNIKRIEVITNPSAKYKAEGNTGIINIVLKKQEADFYSANIIGMYTPAKFNAGELSGNYNFKKGKFLLSSWINRAKGLREYTESFTINYPSQYWVSEKKGKRHFNNINGRFSLDYIFSEKSSLGFDVAGSLQKTRKNYNSDTHIYNKTQQIDSMLFSKNNYYDEKQMFSINSHYQTKLDTLGKKLFIDIDYFSFNKDIQDLSESSSPNDFANTNNIGDNNIKSLSGKIDFEFPLEFAKLDYGVKVSRIKNNSGIKSYDIISDKEIINNNSSNVFDYIENNQAIYFSAKREINKKWKTQMGLRVEATQTKGYSKTLDETTKHNYIKLFPSFYLSYSANKNNSFSLSYGKRVKRPYYHQLNPFRYTRNLYSYTEGNPSLKPSYIDNIELSHSYKDLFQTSVYFKRIVDGFNFVKILHENNITQIIPENYYNSYVFGLTETISFKVAKFWDTNNSIYIHYSNVSSTIPSLKAENEGLKAYIYTSNSFILNTKKTLFATLGYWYIFPGTSTLDKFEAYSDLEIGLKALLCKKKIRINLSGSDLFRKNIVSVISHTSDGIKTTNSFYNDNRRLNLSITYSFGNRKIRSKNQRASNREEKNRIN